LSHGDLVDDAGASVGAFSTSGFCMQTPFASSLPGSPSLEFQTLSTADGALFGMGAPGPGAAGARHRAILGGTGRFAGIRGTYVERDGEAGAVEFLVTPSA
jgi:hypothetical protein